MFAGSVDAGGGRPARGGGKLAGGRGRGRVRPTVVAVALVVALPNASSRVTVKALVGEVLAPPLKAFEVMASCVPVPPVMVSAWVPEVRPVAAAVMVGVPTFVSP